MGTLGRCIATKLYDLKCPVTRNAHLQAVH